MDLVVFPFYCWVSCFLSICVWMDVREEGSYEASICWGLLPNLIKLKMPSVTQCIILPLGKKM